MRNRIRLTLDLWVLVIYVIDITSCGIQQNHPIDGHKSLPLESSSSQLSAYVAAPSTSSAGSAHRHQQLQQPLQTAGSATVPQSTGVGIGSSGKWEEPYFDDTTPRNVTALVGKSAYLSCRVKNLGNKTVSWIRHRDIHILTVGSYTYTSDQRFQATHHKNTDDWTLQIKWAQKRDAGIYECQISTQPVRSYFVTLSVVVPTATIIGGPDLHVDKGSTINLTCAVKYSPEPPAYIFWYHHDEVISYDSSRGGVSVITEKGDVTTSHLLIQNADLDDSGKYSCSPSNADVASVRVHVLNGEHPEAMQTGAASKPGLPFLLVISFGTMLTSWLFLIRWQMNGTRLAFSNCQPRRRSTNDEWKSPSNHLSRQFDGSPVRQRKKQPSVLPIFPLTFALATGTEKNTVESICLASRQWSGR
ncbi:junctional adhesion molecule A-like isoform X2 [Malaya genurostris]|uniref:junctional adhesion molecule A-like isoform X2 n=1 Tax=Malaya genurostris TaxID=325434 RepID=UPI0026F38636|nr:junctional adhesion molecule A-like isoform X2 [Malaya genurostris]